VAESPIVTIGIPVYNEERFLALAIESVLKQSLTNFELIITDNCSTDNSYQIAMSYAEKDNRIKVYRHDKNMGIPYNFRYSLLQATTKYFVWLGAHDLFTTDYLRNTVEYLEKNENVLMVYPNAEWIDTENKFISKLEEDIETIGLSKKNALKKVLKNNDSGIAVHGVYRTSILNSVPFGMDEILMFFIVAIHGDIVKLNFAGILFRVIRVETVEERLKRYKDIKILNKSTLSFTIARIRKHLFYTWKVSKMNFFAKVSVSYSVIKKFMIIELWIQYKKSISKGSIKTVKTGK
jgi:glycosyltransferase involved in cell wall biosynthesis